jgi:hypothetical protein
MDVGDKMKKSLSLGSLVITAALTFPAFVTAAPILGQGLPTDNVNLAGGTVIDFESTGVVNVPSLSISGVTFTGNTNIEVDSDFAGNYNTRGTFHMTNHGSGPDSFRFDFDAPVDAFAFLWGAADYDWTLSAFNGNTLLETLILNPTRGSNLGDYFGIAHAGMTHATLTGNFIDYVFIDNFTVKSADVSAVPVPAAVWLFGSGLMGLMGFNRKRVQSAA